MSPPPEWSFATPPLAGPEWGRPAWPQCTEMLKGEEKTASQLPNSSSQCTKRIGIHSLPKSQRRSKFRLSTAVSLGGTVFTRFLVSLLFTPHLWRLSAFLIIPYLPQIYPFPEKGLIERWWLKDYPSTGVSASQKESKLETKNKSVKAESQAPVILWVESWKMVTHKAYQAESFKFQLPGLALHNLVMDSFPQGSKNCVCTTKHLGMDQYANDNIFCPPSRKLMPGNRSQGFL